MWAKVDSQPIENVKLVQTARKYLYVRESGYNSGKEVEMFLRTVGLPKGNSWCAAFVRFCLDEVKARAPSTRSAMAQSYKTSESIRASWVAKGYRLIAPGWLGIMSKYNGARNTGHGHIVIVTVVRSNSFDAIAGNTSIRGSLDDGDGVAEKSMKIIGKAKLRFTYFTPTY